MLYLRKWSMFPPESDRKDVTVDSCWCFPVIVTVLVVFIYLHNAVSVSPYQLCFSTLLILVISLQ